MNSRIFTAALSLAAKQGFSVIPVGRDKKPLIPWKEFQARPAAEDELEEWFLRRWPHANLAIVTGAVSGLVVADADGDAGLAWMREHLPVTGVYVRTGKGWHGYYRHPGKDVRSQGRVAPEVDIRADGGYVVAPPSVHASGAEYEWHFTPGLEGWDSLAQYRMDASAKDGAFPHGARTTFAGGPAFTAGGFDLSGVKGVLTPDPVPPGQRNDTLTRLVGQWLARGQDARTCLYTATGWNAGLPSPLPLDEVRRTVDSVCRAEARNHPERNAELPRVEAVAREPEEDAEWPEQLLHPGGLLEAVMAYTARASAVSHPVFALAGAITAVGTLAGQKWMTETGLRTNMYCIALGYSGAGKDAPQSALPQIFQRSRAADCLGGNALTSDAALLRHLANDRYARSLFLLDELGLLLSAIKRPGSYAAEIPMLLMKLFSGTDRGFAKRYANSANDVDVKWHHLSLYGASTPDRFWEGLTRGEATDGFLARCLIFESRHEVARPKARTDVSVPAPLLARVNALADFMPPVNFAEGNLRPTPAPVVIGKTEEAERDFYQWADRYHDLRNAHLRDDEGLSSIYGRAAEHAHKLALIHAVSLRGANPETVDKNDVAWACALVDRIVGNMARQLENSLADSEFQKFGQRAMKAIRNYMAKRPGSPGAPRWYIENYLKGCRSALVDEIITKLERTGDICIKTHQGKAGPVSVRYCPAKRVRDEEL